MSDKTISVLTYRPMTMLNGHSRLIAINPHISYVGNLNIIACFIANSPTLAVALA